MARRRLAAVLIARDEARSIARCVRSVTGVVDAVIVLDTGSHDDTDGVASALGAEVHRLPWADDFSIARNCALDIADAAWNLVIDADEWLASGREELDVLTEGSAASVGQVLIDSSFDDADQTSTEAPSFAPSWVSRLLPHGVRYVGRVHEQPVHALPVRRTTLRLGHDGYLSQYRCAKADRNRRLLQRDIADRPDDPYLAYQLGKDHEIAGEFGEAARWYASASQRAPVNASYAHDLLIRHLYTLKRLGLHADAVQLAEHEMAHWPASPDFYFTLGDLLLDWAAVQPSRAAELLPMAEASWRRCIDIGENDRHEGAVAGRGSWLAAHNLSVVCDGTGRQHEAGDWRRAAQRWRTEAPDKA